MWEDPPPYPYDFMMKGTCVLPCRCICTQVAIYLGPFWSITTIFQVSRKKGAITVSLTGNHLVFNLTNGCFLDPPFSSNSLWRKLLPGWTALHPCCNFPTSNCKSLTGHVLFGNYSTTNFFNSLNLCGGRYCIICSASSFMPMNAKQVAGPSYCHQYT